MKFGLFHTVQWPEGRAQPDVYREAIAEAVRADELGLHSVWLTEHHFNRHGLVSDSLNVLSHLAALTSRIRLGTAVAVLPFHNPVRLAEAAATVDLLSGGRLDLGIGRGYQPQEFAGFDVDMADRATSFDESLDVILRSWSAEETFEHHGRFWRFGPVDPQPKPIQRPHPPIWMATDSPDGLARCAEEDWGVMFPQGRSLEVVADQMSRYRQALADAGRDFDPSKVVLARGMYVDETDDQAWAVAGKPYVEFLERASRLAAPARKPSDVPAVTAVNPFDTETLADAVIFGSAETCTAKLEAIRELGIEYVIFFIRFMDMTHEAIMASLDRFAADVAPGLSPTMRATT